MPQCVPLRLQLTKATVQNLLMVYALVAARWLLALLFLTSGVSKLVDRGSFAIAIDRYEIVSTRYTPALSSALPGLEIVLGVAFAIGILPAVAGWCASGALLVFAAAVTINLARGRRFDCGCGGTLQREISWSLVARNVILAAIAAIVAIRPAGLALWTAGLANGHISAPARDLIAMPLAVIAAAVGLRCVLAYRAATRAVETVSPDGVVG